MRIAYWFSPLDRLEKPTGVGQHALGMLRALAEHPDVALTLVVPKDRLAQAGALAREHGIGLVAVPLSDTMLRWLAVTMGFVSIDRWLPEVDWVYSPAEQPIQTRHRLAVTIHDLFPFEKQIPGMPPARGPSWSWRLRIRRILRKATLIATVSEFTRGRLLDLFEVPRPERIVVIGNGGAERLTSQDTGHDAELLKQHRLAARQYVLFPASLTWRKGGDIVLGIAQELVARKSSLVVVGIGRRHDPDLQQRWREMQAKQPELPYRQLGYVDDATLGALYRNAHVVVFPSRYEGFGIPVAEAQACGCPTLVSKQEALQQVGKSSVAVGSENPSDWLAQISSGIAIEPATLAQSTWMDAAGLLLEAAVKRQYA